MTTEPKPPVSSGFLQILGVVVAGAIAFAVVQRDGEANTRAITDHELRIRALEHEVVSRLSRIESQLENLSEKIEAGGK